jgi:hypothetical protein
MASTNVSVSATLLVNNKPVVVKSESLAKLRFTINEPVKMGSLLDFKAWLRTEYGMDLALVPSTADPTWPQAVQDAYTSFANGVVSLDVLTIDRGAGFYQLGVSYELEPALPLIGSLKFDKIGVVITRQSIWSTLEDELKNDDKIITLHIPHGDSAKFNPQNTGGTSAQDTIQIDDEQMVVTASTPGGDATTNDTLTVTRTPGKTSVHAKGSVIWIMNR